MIAAQAAFFGVMAGLSGFEQFAFFAMLAGPFAGAYVIWVIVRFVNWREERRRGPSDDGDLHQSDAMPEIAIGPKLDHRTQDDQVRRELAGPCRDG